MLIKPQSHNLLVMIVQKRKNSVPTKFGSPVDAPFAMQRTKCTERLIALNNITRRGE